MRKKIIAANWKMHGDLPWVEHFCKQLGKKLKDKIISDSVVLFPPAPFLLVSAMHAPEFALGVQNFYPSQQGAYTGELSLSMLPKTICQYALVGHSERRHLFQESEKFIAEKFHHAKEHGIVPVLCVGETDSERNAGQTEIVLTRQLEAITAKQGAFANAVIAYEPVWAIGTGKTASPEWAQKAHALIRQLIAMHDENEARNISILYGGSVNANNAEALFAMPDIDGGLVGGASLEINQFLDVIECIS